MGESYYIAIDPGAGAKGTGLSGYARFALDGSLVDMLYYEEDEVKQEFMNDIWNHPQAVICETWALDPKLAKVFAWSEMPTCKLIGWLEGVCYMQSVTFVLQRPQIKKMGYQHWGKKPLPHSNPMNHAYDAVVHGREYLIKQGVIQA